MPQFPASRDRRNRRGVAHALVRRRQWFSFVSLVTAVAAVVTVVVAPPAAAAAAIAVSPQYELPDDRPVEVAVAVTDFPAGARLVFNQCAHNGTNAACADISPAGAFTYADSSGTWSGTIVVSYRMFSGSSLERTCDSWSTTESTRLCYLRVFDSSGVPQARVNITFAGHTAPPATSLAAALTASPATGQAPLQVTLDASASRGPAAIASYAFNAGDGTTPTGPQSGATSSHTYTTAGTFTASVTVTDSAGATATTTTTVTVSATPPPPANVAAALVASPVTGTAPLVVTLDADGSTGATSYVFVPGDGTPATPVQAAATFRHTYTSPGTFTPTVHATGAGGTDSASTTVTVSPAPSPTMALVTTGDTGRARFSWTVDASSATSPNGRITSWTINFGDGTPAVSDGDGIAQHVFVTAGTYTVTVTATDSTGASVTRQKVVRVTSATDGGKIAFERGSTSSSKVYIADAVAGSSARRATAFDASTREHMPAWSPDGNRIALRYGDSAGGAGITVISPGAASPQLRLPGSLNAMHPTWSPEGRQIAFVDYTSDAGADREVYVANADGTGTARRVTSLSGFANSPSWASNGLIYVTHSFTGGTEIVGVDPATGALRETVRRSTGWQGSYVLSPAASRGAWTTVDDVLLAERNSTTSPRASPAPASAGSISAPAAVSSPWRPPMCCA